MKESRQPGLSRQQALILMLLCLLAAALLRIPALESVPPGLHYDEAANAILSGDIGLRGERPVFIASYTGKEPLFFYLSGGLMSLLGETVFSLRLAAAFIGLLTVAATYSLGCILLRDRRIALLAAVLLAVSFWHLMFSRLGFRAISQPLFQALTVTLLWRGFHLTESPMTERATPRRLAALHFIAAGICVGLTAYTYLAARLFPVLLLLALVPLLTRRDRWPRLALFGVTALLVVLPLLNYFWQHPAAFWTRIEQVAPGEAGLRLTDSIWLSLKMVFIEGDPYWRFNLPGRPLFWLPIGLLLLAGLLSLALKVRSQPYRTKAAFLLLLLAPFIMLLPTALATNEIVPSNLRAIGLIPFIFYLPAIGFVVLGDWAAERIPRIRSRPGLTPLLALLILGIGGISAWNSYFVEWAGRSDVFYETDADLGAVAEYIDNTGTGDDAIYAAALHYRHPTLAFLSERYDEIHWLPLGNAIVLPADRPARIIYPHSQPPPAWTAPYLDEATRENGAAGPDGAPLFQVYRLEPPYSLPQFEETPVNFGNALQFHGAQPGEARENSLPLTLFWQVTGVPAVDFSPFIHLVDAWGHRWSQAEPLAYPSEQWQVGDIIIIHTDVLLPPGAPPGSYTFNAGWFNQASGDRLPRLDTAGRFAGTVQEIGPFQLNARPVPPTLPVPAILADSEPTINGLELLGYERAGETAFAGDQVSLSLWWLAEEPPFPDDWRLRFSLTGGVENPVLTNTHPVQGSYPFSQWTAPQFVIDRHSLPLSPDLAAGEYQLQLALLDGEERVILQQSLGELTVLQADRLYTPPPLQVELDALLGGEIRLLGYDLAGQELSLIWQAEAVPSTNFTVFVHLLGEDGACCPWQVDQMPKDNSYPTGRWLPGEVVVDQYTLPADLPPGDYPLEVGLYIAESGQRLQIQGTDSDGGDALMLAPYHVPAE